ncbi:MAG: hypothetical protein ACR2RL_21655 [Gammaproteobacteria bacterium]
MAIAVMTDDLRAGGLDDADAQRVSDAMECVGRFTTRWPRVGDVIKAMAPRPTVAFDAGVDPPWLAKLKSDWWSENADLKRQAGEAMEAHAMRLRAWCLAHGLARITGELEEVETACRVPGEDDE